MGGCSSSCNWSNEDESVRSFSSIQALERKKSKTCSDYNSMSTHFPCIPDRISSNGRTQSSCIFTQQGRKGVNQDSMIIWENFVSEDTIFCGVFDGHGPFGHLVSRKVRDRLPIKLISFLHSSQSNKNGSGTACFKNNSKSNSGKPENSGFDEYITDGLWKEAFLKSYKAMDKELRSNPNMDCFCSGSTAVTIVKQGLNLFIGNIGDSRAIMGSKDGCDCIVATQLTVDLKPDLPREAERIKRCKGRVFALQDEPEVPRVWLPFDDAPGLAMARAFGDFCLKEYGVISIPEFSHRILTESDQFIVLASDGVWDVLSNDEVVSTVCLAPSRSLAAKTVVESAAREWNYKYPISKMDDCAVVCLFLDGKIDSESNHGYSTATLAVNQCTTPVEMESDGLGNSEPYLQRNSTVRSSVEDLDWSGLEGVTRVNSLVQLPRYSQEHQKAYGFLTPS